MAAIRSEKCNFLPKNRSFYLLKKSYSKKSYDKYLILRVAVKNFMQIDPLVSSNKIFLVSISKILMREKCIKVLRDINSMLWINC